MNEMIEENTMPVRLCDAKKGGDIDIIKLTPFLIEMAETTLQHSQQYQK